MSPALTGWDATRHKRARRPWRTPATMNGVSVAIAAAAAWTLFTLPVGFGWAAWPVGIAAGVGGVWANLPRLDPRYHLQRRRARGRRPAPPRRAGGPANCSDHTCPYRNPDPARPCRCSCRGTQCGVWLR